MKHSSSFIGEKAAYDNTPQNV